MIIALGFVAVFAVGFVFGVYSSVSVYRARVEAMKSKLDEINEDFRGVKKELEIARVFLKSRDAQAERHLNAINALSGKLSSIVMIANAEEVPSIAEGG